MWLDRYEVCQSKIRMDPFLTLVWRKYKIGGENELMDKHYTSVVLGNCDSTHLFPNF